MPRHGAAPTAPTTRRVSIYQHCAELAARPIASLTLEDVLRTLRPLYDRAPNFAALTRARIAEIFDYAQARGLLPQDRANPADRRRLQILLPDKPAAVHRAALPYREVPALVAELRAIALTQRGAVVARALEFTILTALKVREACEANWSEVDLDGGQLIVSAQRMKAGREHIVPLSSRAVAILREMEHLRNDGDVVFPAAQAAQAVDPESLRQRLKSLRPGVTTHGFRSSFRDWCGDATTFPREVAEGCLAHVVGGVEGAYRRGSALSKRSELMAAWGRFCGGEETAKVVALHGR